MTKQDKEYIPIGKSGGCKQLEPVRKFLEHEILELQNNVYKFYIILKTIERTNEFSLRDLKVLSFFGHNYIFDSNNPYDDEDFTLFSNIYDCWVEDYTGYLRKLPDKEEKEKRKEFYENDRKLILESIKSISRKYFVLKFLVKLNVEGTVMYGKYLGQRILIAKDKEYDIFYNVYLWYEDTSEDKEELFAMTRRELKSLFKQNEVVVKWDEEKKEWREKPGSGGGSE
jgi:hypothetical protein